MKRTPMPPRKEPMARTRPASRRGKRSASETVRVYGTEERAAWMRSHGCLCCGFGPVEIAHVKTGGMGRKADSRWTVPLTPDCHRELHRVGVKTFEARHAYMLSHLTLEQWAEWYENAWRRFAGLEPLASIVPRALAELEEEAS